MDTEALIEVTIYKMIQEGKIFLNKNIDMNNGDIKLSLNCVLHDVDDDGKEIRYEANPSGENGVKLK